MHITDLPERSQDYLKTIYDLQDWSSSSGGAGLSELAAAMGQRRSTTSEAIKRLAAAGLVNHEPYADITLTDDGQQLALALIRRHRLIETYLVTHLGYGVEEVHEEAETLEHAVSDLFIERVDTLLGHPSHDPHGDPIPSTDGQIAPQPEGTVSLAALEPGTECTISRIRDRDEALLRYLTERGIAPGVRVAVRRRPYPGMAELEVLEAAEGGNNGLLVQLSATSLEEILGETTGQSVPEKSSDQA